MCDHLQIGHTSQWRTHGFKHWTLRLAHPLIGNNTLWLDSPARGQQLRYPRSASACYSRFSFFFLLLGADQALGIFISWSKLIDSLKPVPSWAADLIDMVMRQDLLAGRPCFSPQDILVWRFLSFPQEQASNRCLIRTDCMNPLLTVKCVCMWQRAAKSTNIQEQFFFLILPNACFCCCCVYGLLNCSK